MTRLQHNRIKFTWIFLLASLVCQQHLSAQRNDRFGLTFLDPKFPKKEPLVGVNNPANQYLRIYEEMLVEAFVYSPQSDSIDIDDFEIDYSGFHDFILNHQAISKDEKAKYCYKKAKSLCMYPETDGKVYHIINYLDLDDIYDSLERLQNRNENFEYFDLFDDSTTMLAALEVIHYFQIAAIYASCDEDRRIILIHLIDYAMESGTLSYIFDRVRSKELSDLNLSKTYIIGFPSYCSYFKKSETTHRYQEIMMSVYHAYVETNYSGDLDFNHFTPAVNMRYDSDFWIGGEIALEFSQHRYLYAYDSSRDGSANIRISTFHFGMNVNLNQTNQREFYFGLLRLSHLHFFHLKLVQFGFIQNVPDIQRNLWFYRPQIGLSYGNFQLFYSFTQPLKKDYRQLIPRHAINLRIVFPYFRVSGYSNY
jgi:hypothetical protein